VREPGPDHPITIEPEPRRVVVRFAGRVVADSSRALSMREASYPAVVYVPLDDVDLTLLRATTHSSHCPYKGDASYHSIEADGRVAQNAVWVYEAPFPAVAAIAGHVSFYPDRVDAIELV
jgi:uncharacterized protein (DUF427 family)